MSKGAGREPGPGGGEPTGRRDSAAPASRMASPPASDTAGSAAAPQANPPGAGSPAPGRLRSAARYGAGGRWWIWLGRAVLWAFILVLAVNGGHAMYVNVTDGPARPAPVAQPTETFPVGPASAYAQRFADVYLNYDEASADARARRLETYLPDGMDPQLGWNGAGTSRLGDVHVAGVDVRDGENAVVTLAVEINGTWMRLGVPVHVSGDAMVISGHPALLPAPSKAVVSPSPGVADVDSEATRELARQLPGFFRAYAASDSANLGRYLDQNVTMTGLSGAVRFVALQDLTVPPGGNNRTITATVIWRIPQNGPASPSPRSGRPEASELGQSYELSVTKDNGNWYVRDISGSTMRSGR